MANLAILVTALAAQQIRQGDRRVTRQYLGEELIWEEGMRNIIPWGTEAELTAGEETAPRLWSAAILHNLQSDWNSVVDPTQILNKPLTISDITETVVQVEAGDHIWLQDASDSNRIKRIRADNFIPALFGASIAFNLAHDGNITLVYNPTTNTLTAGAAALRGLIDTYHPQPSG